MLSLFLDGSVAAFASAAVPLPDDVAFSPLPPLAGSAASVATLPSSAPAQLQLMPLFTAVIGSLRRDSSVKLLRSEEIIQRLLRFIEAAPSAAAPVSSSSSSGAASVASMSAPQQSAIELVAGLLNKFEVGDPLLQALTTQLQDQVLPRINSLAASDADPAASNRAITLFIWVSFSFFSVHSQEQRVLGWMWINSLTWNVVFFFVCRVV